MPLDLSALNDAQREAVTAEPGVHLVIAGAGTGKTRTLTYRAAWLVERGLEGKKLLLLTFTNKAARSMSAQASALLGGEGKEMVQGTFHSVANRLLREFGERIGQPPTFSILDMEDQRSLVRSVVRERLGRLDHFFPSPGVLVNILSYSFNKGASLEDAMMAKAPQAVEHMAKVYAVAEGFEERKRDTNSVDFDDLLRLWRRLLDVPEVCRELGERYGEVLVDEYQDTNGVQGEIADLLAQANGGRLMVVGDDCQSIYAFRGAVYENILGFTARHPEAVLHRLEDNYRSTEEVLDLANTVIAHNTRQYQKTLRPARPTHGPRPVVQPLPNAHAEAAWVAQWVLSRHRQGLGLEQMAVLYRSHTHGVFLQAELVRRGVPHEVRSGVRFFEKAHIKDVVAMLKVLVNPRDEIAWIRVLGMVPGVGPARARKVISWARSTPDLAAGLAAGESTKALPPKARPVWTRFEADLAGMAEMIARDEPLGALLRAAAGGVYDEYLEVKYQGPEMRRQELDELSVLADGYSSVSSFLSELVLLGELYGKDLAAAPEGERLVLSTVHQAKGLEWERVVVMRASDDSFPSPGGLREKGGEEEERRIFYVAATRAKRELVFTYTLLGNQWGGAERGGAVVGRPSRFLVEGRAALKRAGHAYA